MDFKTKLVIGLSVVLVLAAGALLFTGEQSAYEVSPTAYVAGGSEPEEQLPAEEVSPGETSGGLVVGEEPRFLSLTPEDVPGFTVTGQQVRRFAELPAELQALYEEFGFIESHEVWLQAPVVQEDEEISDDFRQVQSGVFLFSGAEGAEAFFEKQREGVQASPDLVEFINVSYGDAGFAYVEEYERGAFFEQHFLGFVENNYYALVSVTALKSANMSADLLFQAADALEAKLSP